MTVTLSRFLVDTVFIERSPGTGPSGEPLDPTPINSVGVPCRIRSARESESMRFSSEELAVGAFTAIFRTDVPLIKVNDRLRRQLDGQTFRVIGFPNQQGDTGHGMAHIQVPVVQLG